MRQDVLGGAIAETGDGNALQAKACTRRSQRTTTIPISKEEI